MSKLLTNELKMHNKLSLTNLYFNRFLAVRYSTAFFLFLNLYWAVFLAGSLSIAVIIPLFLFILAILTAFEQIKLYRKHSNHLPYARFFYRSLMIVCIMLMIALYSPLYHFFFPFLKNNQNVLNVMTVLLLVSSLITFLMLKKLNKILRNEDKHFKRIQAYEDIIN